MFKSAIVISSNRTRMINAEGVVVYEVEMGTSDQAGDDSAQSAAARLLRERTQCLDCGARISYGALYCVEDAPYGFWHWLKYFSAFRWNRRAESTRRLGMDSER